MSDHNLADHLEWLLRSKPHVPSPPTFPSPPATDDSIDGLSTTSSSAVIPLPAQDVQPVAIPHFDTTALTADRDFVLGSSLRSEQAMARLRTAPSPARRQPLPSKASGETPRGVGQLDDVAHNVCGGDDYERESQSLDFHVIESPSRSTLARTVREPRPALMTPVSPRQYDTIDLTDDIELSDDNDEEWNRKITKSIHKRPAICRTTGRDLVSGQKRKSGDLEDDLQSPSRRRSRSPVLVFQAARNQISYASVPADRFSQLRGEIDGSSPPPPYSTSVHPTPQIPQDDMHPLKEDLSRYFSSQGESSSEDKGSLGQRISPEKARTLAKGDNRGNNPPQADRISASVSPDKSTRILHVAIADSEDESDLDDLIINGAAVSNSPQAMVDVVAHTPARSTERTVERTAKHSRSTPTHLAIPQGVGGIATSTSQMKPLELVIDNYLPPLQLLRDMSRAEPSMSQDERQKRSLERFGNLASKDLRTYWDELATNRASAKASYTAAIESEDFDAIPVLQKAFQQCVARMKSFQGLIETRCRHVALSRAREAFKTSLSRLADSDDGNVDLGPTVTGMRENKLALKEIEATLISLIEATGLDQAREPQADQVPAAVPRLSISNGPDNRTKTKARKEERSRVPAVERAASIHEVGPAVNLAGLETQRPIPQEDTFGDFEDEFDDEDALEAERSAAGTVTSTIIPQRNAFAERSGNEMASPKHVSQLKQLAAANTSDREGVWKFPWSDDVKHALARRFLLTGFRPNQLKAINATLSGKDVFVLMPTGGGKSLCYQLPAIIQSGNRKGVTVVISPLLSLMEDQVQHLEKLQIQSKLINGSTGKDARGVILQALKSAKAEQLIQLLYITPEMLRKSKAIVDVLDSLYKRNKLARLVIDEAHCVSQWGHDFRPDYKDLGLMRPQFAGVPLMALTATATENVRADVRHNLGMEDCEVLTQSFNRPNLFYTVRPKKRDKELLEDIAQTIKKEHGGQSGIIYCLSKKSCEKVAAALYNEHRIKAHHYHADMTPEDKSLVQKKWQAKEYQVIVATIAFGMGIDKADVRFVIHHSFPKTLEGYYQETGRAGRDGKSANCYLYYAFREFKIFESMIQDSDGSQEQKARLMGMLKQVVQFCENRFDCRRSLVLGYFGEKFSKPQCMGRCDNCQSDKAFESMDMTDYAKQAISLVRKVTGGLRPQEAGFTLIYCTDLFRGAKGGKEQNHLQFPEFGAGSDLQRNDVERLFHRLLIDEVFTEHHVANRKGFVASYIRLGKRHKIVEGGAQRIVMQVPLSPDAKTKKSKKAAREQEASKKATAASSRAATSTYVSSPIQAVARSRRRAREIVDIENDDDDDDGFIVPDDEEELSDEEAFAPAPAKNVRKAATKRVRSYRMDEESFGPPITRDERLDELGDVHQYCMEEFLMKAREINKRRMLDRGLREMPFSDTVLREMGISFPQTKAEMCSIPDIDPDKVEAHGDAFFKLINDSKTYLEDMMLKDGDRPDDPNREIVDNVVDLIDSDDEVSIGNTQSSADEVSSHFRTIDPEAAAFNAALENARRNDFSQQQARPTYQTTDNPYGKRKSLEGGPGAGGPSYKRRSYEKGNGGSRTRRGTGRGGRQRANGASTNRTGTSRTGVGQSRLTSNTGFGGISAMPT